MPSTEEERLGIVGYAAECATDFTENGNSRPQKCLWKSGCCANSTAATDALYQHFRLAHQQVPFDSCLGYVIPVDALPADASIHA